MSVTYRAGGRLRRATRSIRAPIIRALPPGGSFINGKSYYGIDLPLGAAFGGPLFFAHYSFCAIDPRGLKDRYADYWQQNVNHVRINHAHCVKNPQPLAGL